MPRSLTSDTVLSMLPHNLYSGIDLSFFLVIRIVIEERNAVA